MGLGLLGRGAGDAVFLAECGAKLTITDMKDEKALAPSLEKLKDFKEIKYTLGKHDLKDFENRDFILKAAGVPLDSIYIDHARKNNIPIEMDASLFVKLAPKGIRIIGVTGTRGKSTVTHLIANILQTAGKSVLLGGNVRDTATLPLIEEAQSGDFVVLELDSWQLQGFGDAKISPHIAVFTAFMKDHMNYYNNDSNLYFSDKANIYKFQNKGDTLVVGENVASVVAGKPHGDGAFVIAEKDNVPTDWQPKILGEHNLLNISCAIEACKALGISEEDIKDGVESFEAVEGRLQFVKEVNGVKIYNDNNATTPEATVAALRALDKNIILIMGGADKGLDTSELLKEIPLRTKKVILLPGTGSEKMNLDCVKVKDLKEALDEAIKAAEQGDIILFSPAFASFGQFKNEYDKNDQFMDIVKNLK